MRLPHVSSNTAIATGPICVGSQKHFSGLIHLAPEAIIHVKARRLMFLENSRTEAASILFILED